jgi:DNA-binding protein
MNRARLMKSISWTQQGTTCSDYGTELLGEECQSRNVSTIEVELAKKD